MRAMEIPKIAMVVGAHPDDCEFGAGGTVWKWGQSGCQVHFVIVTDGGQGSAGAAHGKSNLVELRQTEQIRAAKLLGVTDCHFLDYPDGALDNDHNLLKDLVRLLREVKPEVVLTHTTESLDYRPFDKAEGSWINHRDHRACGQAVLDAVYPYSRNPNSFEELGLAAHKVGRVLLWGRSTPNWEIDVGQGMNKKAQALACHRSQFPAQTDWKTLVQLWGPTEKFEVVELSE